MAEIKHPQWFPAYYPASGRFKDNGGQDSGAARSTSILSFEFPTRPHVLLGLRIENVWSVDNIQQLIETLGGTQTQALINYIQTINAAQTIKTEFTQSDVVVKPTLQRLVTGGGDPPQTVHWHPLPCPYLLRGGNKAQVTVERLISYPTITLGEQQIPIIPTIHAVWECMIGVEGAAWGGNDWGVPTFGMMGPS